MSPSSLTESVKTPTNGLKGTFLSKIETQNGILVYNYSVFISVFQGSNKGHCKGDSGGPLFIKGTDERYEDEDEQIYIRSV